MPGELRIYVIFHKPFAFVPSQHIVQYQVGSHFKQGDEQFAPYIDAEGKHIGQYHPRIGEYAAYYQIGKNHQLPDYVGFMQYRRYFALAPEREGLPTLHVEPSPQMLETLTSWLNPRRVASILSRHEIIVPTRYHCGQESLAAQMARCHGQDVYDTFIEGLRQAGETSALDWLENEHRFHLYNMFISRREIFMRYMQDAIKLLGILLALLPEIDHPYQKRRISFCMERYFAYWVYRNKLRIYETQVCLLEPDAC